MSHTSKNDSSRHSFMFWYLSPIALLWSSSCVPVATLSGPSDYSGTTGQTARSLSAETFRFELTPPREEVRGMVVLRFLHISDVQYRDSGVKLDLARLVEALARLQLSGITRENLDDKEESFLLSLVYAVNRYNRNVRKIDNEKIKFVLHTGDAVDVGTTGELRAFISDMNRLDVPWYNVIGNHDAYFHGAYPNGRVQTKAIQEALGLIDGRTEFIKAHNPTHRPTEDLGAGSSLHGFDKSPSFIKRFYSILVSHNPTVRLIVLDTTKKMQPDLEDIGAAAYSDFCLDLDQTNFLKQTIENNRNDMIIVAGHHPLLPFGKHPDDRAARLKRQGAELPLRLSNRYGGCNTKSEGSLLHKYLEKHQNVLAYLAGHTHFPMVRRYLTQIRKGNRAHPFVEIIAPSIHEYPQFGYEISLSIDKSSLGNIYLTARPFAGVPVNPQNYQDEKLESEEKKKNGRSFYQKWKSACKASVEHRRRYNVTFNVDTDLVIGTNCSLDEPITNKYIKPDPILVGQVDNKILPKGIAVEVNDPSLARPSQSITNLEIRNKSHRKWQCISFYTKDRLLAMSYRCLRGNKVHELEIRLLEKDTGVLSEALVLDEGTDSNKEVIKFKFPNTTLPPPTSKATFCDQKVRKSVLLEGKQIGSVLYYHHISGQLYLMPRCAINEGSLYHVATSCPIPSDNSVGLLIDSNCSGSAAQCFLGFVEHPTKNGH